MIKTTIEIHPDTGDYDIVVNTDEEEKHEVRWLIKVLQTILNNWEAKLGTEGEG